LRAHVK